MGTGPPRIPGRRWIIGVLLGAGVLVNYIDRINLSVAAPQLQKEFNLSPEELGMLFSAFFWSYSLLQVPGGLVLDRFGVMKVGRWGAFLWAVASPLSFAKPSAIGRKTRQSCIDTARITGNPTS
jgi:ACS family D-galactonate transporter-like MFS transporter